MKFYSFIAGVIFFCFGISLLSNPIFEFYSLPGTAVDVSNYKYLAAFIISAFGAYVAYKNIDFFDQVNQKPERGTFICPDCEQVIEASYESQPTCDACCIQMVNLKGFYNKTNKGV